MEKMYSTLAKDWYRLLTPLEEYEAEAADARRLFDTHARTPIRTMLELGCGAGHNAYYLKQWVEMTLSDLSPDMLALSREINGNCEHVLGDMRTLRLGRVFDAVYIHDAIMYMTTEADLRRALETAFVHVTPGGMLLVSPDMTKETFNRETVCGGSDGDGRALRFLEWDWDPNPDDTTFNTEYVYVMRDAAGHVTLDHERHVIGVFETAVWERLMVEVGFETVRVVADGERERNFVCLKG